MKNAVSFYLEKSVLAACLMSGDIRAEYIEHLSPEHFEVPQHRMIFQAIMAACPLDEEAGIPEVVIHLQETGEIQAIGGVLAVTKLVDENPIPVNSKRAIAKLENLRRVREVVRVCNETARDCQATELDNLDGFLESAEARLSLAVTPRTRQPKRSMASILKDVRSDYTDAKSGKTKLVYSGIKSLDRMIGGFRGGDLVVIAARPSMGKTALSLNMATAMAKRGCPSAFFSLEQGDKQLATRILAAETGINSQLIRHGKLNEYEEMLFQEWADRISRWPIHTCDNGGMTLPDIVHKSKAYKREDGIEAIFIDYLQIISDDRNFSSRNEAVGYLTRGLKALAKQCDVPVFLLSQLNRQLENRADKRPVMSDLRDSGAIEQDADIVIFPYRDWVYNKENDANKHKAELIVAKYRDGPTGTVHMRWEASRTRYFDIEQA